MLAIVSTEIIAALIAITIFTGTVIADISRRTIDAIGYVNTVFAVFAKRRIFCAVIAEQGIVGAFAWIAVFDMALGFTVRASEMPGFVFRNTIGTCGADCRMFVYRA